MLNAMKFKARVWKFGDNINTDLILPIQAFYLNAQEQTRRVFSAKPGGHGIGLLLANAAIERFGGRVTLADRATGGTRTRVELPLAALATG